MAVASLAAERAGRNASRRIAPFRESIWLGMDALFQRHPDTIFFGNGAPAAELMPTERLRAASALAWADGAAALSYGETEGYRPLREFIARQMADIGATADPDEILVVNGSQEGMDILGRALLEPGDVILVEAPTFPDAIRLFASYEVDIVGVPVDADGADIEALPALLDRLRQPPKFFYTIPTFQNPTGSTMPAARRQALADLARERGLLLVEDDPYSAYRYDGEPLPALRWYEPSAVYLGTFSKTVAPGLRVGWMNAPRPLFDRFFEVKEAMNISNDRMMPRTVFHTVDGGFLAEHLTMARAAYRSRRDALLTALADYLPAEARWHRPAGGFFVWIELPERIDTDALLPAAADAGVIYLPGSWFFPGRSRHNALRLSFSSVPEERMAEGIRRLSGVLAEAMAARRG
ncbi:MAG TPA: PLP-dependent aminotransferase family protein [Thermomicrobiales bacterium]|nr:PLP-dependent aminotransferase family protein [Thermomicrobiales bacterium]